MSTPTEVVLCYDVSSSKCAPLTNANSGYPVPYPLSICRESSYSSTTLNLGASNLRRPPGEGKNFTVEHLELAVLMQRQKVGHHEGVELLARLGLDFQGSFL